MVHRVALGLLKCFAADLARMDFEGLVAFLQHELPNRVDPDLVLHASFGISLKGAHIASLERMSERMHAQG